MASVKKRCVKRSLDGILVPCSWDMANEVRGVCLQCFDESEYVIENSIDVDKLKKYIGKKLRMTCDVEEEPDNRVTKIHSFHVA